MIVAVADTHAVVWYLFSDPRLGKAASAFIDEAIANGNHVGVSTITVAEMVYLVEKARIPQNAVYDLHVAASDPNAVLQYVPLDENIAINMMEIHGSVFPIYRTELSPRVPAFIACLF